VALCFVDLRRGKEGFRKLLSPVIEERRRKMQYPDYKKPVNTLFNKVNQGRLPSMADGFGTRNRNPN
jgi:hypothetical protein